MATKLQIARAKARVALASASGKTLPEDIVATAALSLTDAEDYGSARATSSERRPASAPEVVTDDEVPPAFRRSTVLRRDADGAARLAKVRAAMDEGVLLEDDSATPHIFFDRSHFRPTAEPALPVHAEDPLGPVLDLERHALAPGWFGDGSEVRLVSAIGSPFLRTVPGTAAHSGDAHRALVDFTVRSIHAAMTATQDSKETLPVDDDVRAELARKVASDIVAMNPEYAQLIGDAIHDELATLETNQAAEDARLG